MVPIRKCHRKYEILLQKRLNSGICSWKDTWEFPQGKIEKLPNLSIIEFAKVKFKNETGMVLVSFMSSPGIWINTDSKHQEVSEYMPIIISSADGELGIHFFVKGEGIPNETAHADSHTWISVKDLSNFMDNNPICPLNRPSLPIIYNLSKKDIIDKYLGYGG